MMEYRLKTFTGWMGRSGNGTLEELLNDACDTLVLWPWVTVLWYGGLGLVLSYGLYLFYYQVLVWKRVSFTTSMSLPTYFLRNSNQLNSHRQSHAPGPHRYWLQSHP